MNGRKTSGYLNSQKTHWKKKKKRKMRQSPKTNTARGLVELELATEHSVFTTGEGFSDPAFFFFFFLKHSPTLLQPQH